MSFGERTVTVLLPPAVRYQVECRNWGHVRQTVLRMATQHRSRSWLSNTNHREAGRSSPVCSTGAVFVLLHGRCPGLRQTGAGGVPSRTRPPAGGGVNVEVQPSAREVPPVGRLGCAPVYGRVLSQTTCNAVRANAAVEEKPVNG